MLSPVKNIPNVLNANELFGMFNDGKLNGIFILDACALIALLAGEQGAEKVTDIIQDAIDNKVIVKINQINLLLGILSYY